MGEAERRGGSDVPPSPVRMNLYSLFSRGLHSVIFLVLRCFTSATGVVRSAPLKWPKSLSLISVLAGNNCSALNVFKTPLLNGDSFFDHKKNRL